MKLINPMLAASASGTIWQRITYIDHPSGARARIKNKTTARQLAAAATARASRNAPAPTVSRYLAKSLLNAAQLSKIFGRSAAVDKPPTIPADNDTFQILQYAPAASTITPYTIQPFQLIALQGAN